MQQERTRILRMLAEGEISVDECEELLRALGERRQERLRQETEQATKGERPVWPFVLIAPIVLAGVALYALLPHLLSGPLWRPAGMRGLSVLWGLGFGGLMGVAVLVFWVAMLIDCIQRSPADFRLLFTQKFQHEKWVWLGIIVLGQVLGALIYLIVVRQRQGTGERAPSVSGADVPTRAPDQSFQPRRRARPLWPWVVLLLALSALPLLAMLTYRPHMSFGRGRGVPTPSMTLSILPLAALAAFLVLLWVWMLIDCLTRDYREFGALITSDRSADKLLWVLLIVLLPLVGAIAYHVGVRRRPPELRGGTLQ